MKKLDIIKKAEKVKKTKYSTQKAVLSIQILKINKPCSFALTCG